MIGQCPCRACRNTVRSLHSTDKIVRNKLLAKAKDLAHRAKNSDCIERIAGTNIKDDGGCQGGGDEPQQSKVMDEWHG